MGNEIELKLEVSRADARRLPPVLKKFSSGRMQKEKLVSVYYDTAKLALRHRHAVLRVRRSGEGRLQTIKLDPLGVCGPFGRLEWERELEGMRPDLEGLRKKDLGGLPIKKYRDDLKPLFETVVSRQAITLNYEGAELEVAIDNGQVKTGRKRLPIHEVEVECKKGDPAAVVSLAKEIAERVKADYGIASKADRGYRLREGTAEEAVCERRIALDAKATTGEAFQVVALSCLRHFAGNRAAVIAGEAEGVHQMRVGLRRLRAALSVFKQMLRGPETEGVKTELKWLTEALGPARDMDVLIRETVAPLQKEIAEKRAVVLFKKDVSDRRARNFSRAQAAVASERYRKLVLQTALWIAGGGWTRTEVDLIVARRCQKAGAFAARELHRRTGKILKKLDRLEKLNAKKQHKLRIAIKKLRYAAGFFESLFAGVHHRRKNFEKALKKLQSALGKLNDIRTHDRLAGDYKKPPRLRRGAAPKAFVMGLIRGKERGRVKKLLARAAKAGHRLAEAKEFWRGG